jgi:hypothetical protein
LGAHNAAGEAARPEFEAFIVNGIIDDSVEAGALRPKINRPGEREFTFAARFIKVSGSSSRGGLSGARSLDEPVARS